MSLQEQLDAVSTRVQAMLPHDAWDEIERSVAGVHRSGLLARVPGVGTRAPAFTLPSVDGELSARVSKVWTCFCGTGTG
jgi:hypothetical protein